MKIFSFIILFLSQSLVTYSQERIQISEDLSASKLDQDAYVITHVFPRFGSNSLLVILSDQKAVMIDTPNETSGTRDLLEWIHMRFGEKELIALNTGWHQDNLGGNEYLRSKNIDIYGPGLTSSLIKERGDELKNLLLESTENLEDQRYYKSYLDLVLAPPNRLFKIEEGLRLEYGGEIFEVYFPGESHAVDNTVVYLGNRKILFGGCMILSARHQRPGFIEHANMKEWPLSVKKVAQRYPEAIAVIPGHGSAGDVSILDHTVEILKIYNENNPE